MTGAGSHELPAALLDLLLGGRVYREGNWAVPVLTTGGDGWPHVSVVSGFACADARHGLFPLRIGSSAWQNIQAGGQATVLIAVPGFMAYLKGRARPLTESISPAYAVVELEFVQVRVDNPPGVRILSGIGFSPSADFDEAEERRVFLEICRRTGWEA